MTQSYSFKQLRLIVTLSAALSVLLCITDVGGGTGTIVRLYPLPSSYLLTILYILGLLITLHLKGIGVQLQRF